MQNDSFSAGKAFQDVLQTVHRLRAPGGCPWDQKQTHQSLRPYLIEETYEVIDALDQVKTAETLRENETLKKNLIEELGDVFLQILLHSEIASETNLFTIQDVFEALNKKLIHRHPHVFGSAHVSDSEGVEKQWEILKKAEKKNSEGLTEETPLLLSSIPKSLPPLPRTLKIIEKVSKVGFQWNEVSGALEKMEEEVQEFKDEILNPNGKNFMKIEDELGDVLFSASNVAHLLKLDPEAALRRCLQKFENRFNHVERSLRLAGKTWEETNLKEMDTFWNEAKKLERSR